MKKLSSLLILLFLSCLAIAQTQRMILSEEYTQASCGPCASQNPAFNALCDANANKVIGLHYQVSWPGVDPMNAENAAQVLTRVSYYGVGSAPYALLDGTPQAGAAYLGAPYNWTQSAIDNEYAVPSPFTLSASHSFSSDYDSIFITINITAAQAFTSANALKAHVAIVERNIHFTSAPGSNGETDFSWVMRRMLPSDQGTNLGTAWTNGQTQTITLASPLPWYLRNVNQIGVVTFIQQSNSTKTVHQAAYSAPLAPVPATNDASIIAIGSLPANSCNPVNATVTIRNLGTATLTSANIMYQYDVASNWYYNLANSYQWTGSLSTGSSAVVNLPSATLTGNGSHTLTAIAKSPNGAVDINPYNGYKASTTPFFVFPSVGTSTPVVEGFQATTFPPADWTLNNPDNSAYKWIRYSAAGGFGNTSACARMNFFGSTNGQADELFLPAADFQLALSGSFLTFSVAYVQKTAENDRLQIQVSTNCGQTWTTAYDKSGSALSTHAPYSASAWVPAPADWRTDTVYLDNYLGNNNVLIKFKATSNAGNNLYVDDVNLQFVTGIDALSSSSSFDVYPNPTHGILNMNLDGSPNVLISVYNSIGERVMIRELKNAISGPYSLNLSELSAGNYVVRLVNGKNNSVHKITLNK